MSRSAPTTFSPRSLSRIPFSSADGTASQPVIEHLLRLCGKRGKRGDDVLYMALADLGGHDEGNAFDDKEFQCLDGLIATVGDRHALGQARMLQVGPDDIHGAVVIDVAGEGVVVDRLMPIQGIHHHLHRPTPCSSPT